VKYAVALSLEVMVLKKAPLAVSDPPVAVGTPVITGTVQVGQTVTCDITGVFTGDISYTVFQWQSNKGGAGYQPIAGAVEQTYLIPADQASFQLRCLATAGNSGGEASAMTAPTVAVAP